MKEQASSSDQMSTTLEISTSMISPALLSVAALELACYSVLGQMRGDSPVIQVNPSSSFRFVKFCDKPVYPALELDVVNGT